MLYCSKEGAQILLDNAISSENENDTRLYNYDKTHQKFIVFHYEGDTPDNQYHGFHLENAIAKQDEYRWVYQKFQIELQPPISHCSKQL